MTYYPVPGHTHMKVLVPRATFPKVERVQGVRAVPTDPMAPLVRQALDATFGNRGIASLTGALFDLGVRSHVRAKRHQPLPKGEVRVLSCHTRDNGEVFGSIAVGSKRYGFAARMHGDRLVSFKVL